MKITQWALPPAGRQLAFTALLRLQAAAAKRDILTMQLLSAPGLLTLCVEQFHRADICEYL